MVIAQGKEVTYEAVGAWLFYPLQVQVFLVLIITVTGFLEIFQMQFASVL